LLFGALTTFIDVGTLILRLFFGGLLMTHGYPKLTSGKQATVKWLEGVGLPGILGPLIGMLELLGGLFLIIGFLTPIVSLLFALQFASIYLVRKKIGKMTLAEYEKDLLYLGGSMALLFLGGGLYSLDQLLGL
jgi:putative oxidoreductase